MERNFDDPDDDEAVLPIPLDRTARLWLVERARETGAHPRQIAAAIIRDVVEDDLTQHQRVLN